MFKHLFTTFCFIQLYCFAADAQQPYLNARYEMRTPKVIFDWNMISASFKTTYILLRSTDEKKWTVAVTDKSFHNYTEADVFDFDDKVAPDQKYYYRLQIINANNKIIASSNTAVIDTRIEKNSWAIYPNPVNDILNLACKGNNIIKGVINVAIINAAGKIVTKFRASSIYRTLQIPVANLSKGIYVVQISIMNELVMNQKFLKQ